MRQLLFLCTDNSTRSQMAEAFARNIAPDDVKVLSAGTDPVENIHPFAVEVMLEDGIDISGQKPKPMSAIDLFSIDVTVTLCSNVREECPFTLPGQPCKVNWNLPDPAEHEGDRETILKTFRQTRDEIKRLVFDLFNHDYFDSLSRTNNQTYLLLDNLREGVVAHDLNRKITFFNKAAESITGYNRTEVIGRDCHEVFLKRLCGKQCSFCDGNLPAFNSLTFPVTLKTKSGQLSKAEVSVNSIKDKHENIAGMIVILRDLTYENFLEKTMAKPKMFSGIVGRHPKMLEIFDLIKTVGDSNVPVLIQGESGTGKELVALAIHSGSNTKEGLFVTVNCGALPEPLLESELFGHVRGAFTGAIRDKKGRFELADGGTIFLDEIGDISPAMQVKLLRVLQEGAFERLGDTKTIRSNFRVISATNKDLKEEIAAGRFRDDLFYRICVVPICLPPLRERASDIPILVEHILGQIGKEINRKDLTLSANALDALFSYHWPGNIRELQNALQFALVKCKESRIETNHLPPHIVRNLQSATARISSRENLSPSRGRKKKLTKGFVLQALHEANNNKAEAARILGVGRATLYRFINSDLDLDI